MSVVLGDALMSWLHFVLVFAIVATLSAELVLIRSQISKDVMERIAKFDLVYGISALLLLGVGFARAAKFSKGWDFYAHQPFFHLKLTAFIGVGLLSIAPTMQFMKWRKAIRAGDTPVCDDATAKRLRRFVHAELGLMLVIIAAAAMMARDVRP